MKSDLTPWPCRAVGLALCNESAGFSVSALLLASQPVERVTRVHGIAAHTIGRRARSDADKESAEVRLPLSLRVTASVRTPGEYFTITTTNH